MVIAEMWSESRTWLSLGETVNEAKEAIRRKWNQAQRDMVAGGWKNEADIYANIKDMEKDYDIGTTILQVGECEVK